MPRIVRAVGAMTAVVLASAVARAAGARGQQPLETALHLDAGATCLDAAALVAQVRTWLDSDAVEGDLVVEVRGSTEDPRVVTFRVVRGGRLTATRGFDPGPASCEHLHAALGLAIAMALSGSVADEVTGAGRPAAVSDGWIAGASALLTLDVLPDVALGIDARVERPLDSAFALRFGLVALAGVPGAVAGLPAHYDASLLAAYADLCAGSNLTDRIRLEGCAGFEGGAMVARGHSLTVSQAAAAPWLAVPNGVGVVARLGRGWSLDLSLGVVWSLQKWPSSCAIGPVRRWSHKIWPGSATPLAWAPLARSEVRRKGSTPRGQY